MIHVDFDVIQLLSPLVLRLSFSRKEQIGVRGTGKSVSELLPRKPSLAHSRQQVPPLCSFLSTTLYVIARFFPFHLSRLSFHKFVLFSIIMQ